MDVQRTAGAATDLSRFLEKVDKAFLSTVESTLDRMRSNDFGVDLRKRPADEQDRVAADLLAIDEQLAKKERLYAARGGKAAFAAAREDVASLQWAARVYRDEKARGEAMADMTLRALAGLPKGTKAVLWAHDVYVSKRRADGGMGALLADKLKSDYVAIGATFYQGWIRAWDFTQGPTTARGTKLFRLPPADPWTLEAALEAGGIPMFFADVRKASGGLQRWMNARVSMRSAGSVYESDRRARTHTVPAEAFDGLVFVRKQTTVTFTESGRRTGKQGSE